MTPSGLEEGGPSTPKLKVNHFDFEKFHDDQHTLLHLLMQLIS